MKFYTGIGSRRTPSSICTVMQDIATHLAIDGKWVLRSGGASGADTAFEQGCINGQGSREIYLPWQFYNNHTSDLFTPSPETFDAAKRLFNGVPWKQLSAPVKSLMARNVHQVLGENLNTPSNLLICWTPDGSTKLSSHTRLTGGTRLAISVAEEWEIPVINLQSCEFDVTKIEDYSNHLDGWSWT